MTTLVAEAPKQKTKTPTVMKALVYQGPGKKTLEERPMPAISAPTDAIVKITKTTICGTDLHILKGDVPTCKPGAHSRARRRRRRGQRRCRRHQFPSG